MKGRSTGWFDLKLLGRQPTAPTRTRGGFLDRPFDLGSVQSIWPRGWTLTPEGPAQDGLEGGMTSSSVLAGGRVVSAEIRITFGREQAPDATLDWTAHCAEFSEVSSGTLRIVAEEKGP